tara:strand:- start:1884 stop:2171 length:288 start_codon:yes stop_codon:yes gene_type:complete
MATLKSQKMVRGRDLKTPLAASTMDKKSNGKKGGPGDPPKKNKKGEINIKIARDPKRPSLYTNASFTQAQIDRAIQKGVLKKGQGNRYMMIKKKN